MKGITVLNAPEDKKPVVKAEDAAFKLKPREVPGQREGVTKWQ
jgi:hypothetical protein